MLPPDASQKPTTIEHFRRESEALRHLHHENIVAHYEFGEYQGIHYLAMEYVDGGASTSTSPARSTQSQGGQLHRPAGVRTLNHAYKQGIVHRDIKPSNFLLTRKEGKLQIKLTDLGLARREIDNEEFRLTPRALPSAPSITCRRSRPATATRPTPAATSTASAAPSFTC